MNINSTLFKAVRRGIDSKTEIAVWVMSLLLSVAVCKVLYTKKAAAESDLRKEQQLYQWIQAQPAPKKTAGQDARPLTSIAIEAANKHNLVISRVQPKNENLLICSFNGVDLGLLLAWLDELKNSGADLSFSKVHINLGTSENATLVNANIYVAN